MTSPSRRAQRLPTGYGQGATIGQYRVTGVIGQGGMGAVYAAEHTLLGRPAAIKVLLADLSRRQDIVLRFFNEARAAAAIRHPGIVEIYDVGWSADGAAYIAMERLRGESLGRRAARGRLPWQVALALARQIAGALAVAHGKGIIHRDLKPDNIFVVPDAEVPGGERIKLLDFGIAKLTDDPAAARVTRTGAVMGTPSYMAPEQCRGVAVDHRADLYALGCLVFKLCAGRAPFVGAGTGDVLASHIHNAPPRLGSLVPEISPEAEAVIQRLLEKRPEDRPHSAEELIRQIDAATRTVTRLPRPSGSRGPVGGARGARAVAGTQVGPDATTMGSVARGAGRTVSERRHRLLWLGAVIAATSIAASIAVARCGGPAATAESPPAPGEPAHAATLAVASPTVPMPGDATRRAPRTDAAVDRVAVPPGTSTPEVGAPASRAASPPSLAPVEPGQPGGAARIGVVIDSTPPGADVVLDGVTLGTTPFRGAIPRSEGNVTFVIQRAGYARKQIVVSADKPIAQRVTLVGLARPARDRDVSVNPFAR